jgi:ComF family protein
MFRSSLTQHSLADKLKQGTERLVDFILPPRCLGCGGEIARQGDVCATCWRGLSFIDGAMCECCGLPFDLAETAGMLCGPCMAERPVFDRARAALVYDDGSKALVLPFKHADRLDGAPAFARWMARAGQELLDEADVIAAVPLHRWRLLSRRYNQAAVLALGLSRISGKPVIPDALIRTKRTPSQGGLNARARRENVRNAFNVHPAHNDAIKGRRVLLIDDVYTTGATIESASACLLDTGALAVDALALARVVRAEIV